jgi:hypothetical protein
MIFWEDFRMVLSMRKIKKNPLLLFILIFFVIALASCEDQKTTSPLLGIANAANGSTTDTGTTTNTGSTNTSNETKTAIYSAVTDDNYELKLFRYRPSTDVPFNENRQPVLMLGGICMNNDEFTPHTTDLMKEKYSKMTLPDNLAGWAAGDEYIKNDHMLYYNLGYYLWKKGFDPWFANYRGTGRGEMKSEGPKYVSTLDVPGCLDVPALVKKVTEVTGRKPFIGGHSTGALACYVYLQGAYINGDEAIKGRNASPPYIPHVKVSSELAKERNSSIKGYIGIDPAVAPPLPSFLDIYLIWEILKTPIVLPLDTMMETLEVQSGYTGMEFEEIMSYLFNGIDQLAIAYPDSVAKYLQFFRTSEVDPYVLDYFMRYAVSNAYVRMFAQYADWGLNEAMREGYTNGPENTGVVMPKGRKAGDGYYYYEDHMSNITTPTICLMSQCNGLVATDMVYKYLLNLKTPNKLDYFYEVPNTAHADLPIGYQAPAVVFPMIGEWLSKF